MRQIITSICANCGCEFTHEKAKRGRQNRKWCSGACRAKKTRNPQSINSRFVLKCVVCSASFTSTHPQTKACSKECRTAHRKNRMVKYAKERRVRNPDCEIRLIGCSRCGFQFKSRSSAGTCRDCQMNRRALWRAIRNLSIELDRIETLTRKIEHALIPKTSKVRACRGCGTMLNEKGARLCPECRRNKKRTEKNHCRRARRFGVASEHVVRTVVFKRDGWKCQHCGCRCHKAIGSNSNTEATLDHIVPLSKGGPHTYENAQLLCRGCNVSKSNSMRRPEQMRLIG